MSCHFLLHFLLPPDLGIEPASLASALPGGFFTSEMPGKIRTTLCVKYCYSQFTDENSDPEAWVNLSKVTQRSNRAKGRHTRICVCCVFTTSSISWMWTLKYFLFLPYNPLSSHPSKVCSRILQDETLHLFRKYLLSATFILALVTQRFLKGPLCFRYSWGCWGYISEKHTHLPALWSLHSTRDRKTVNIRRYRMMG